MLIQQPRGLRSLLYLIFLVCPILFFTDLTRNPYYTQIAILNFLMPACWLLWLWQAWQKKTLLWVFTDLEPLLWVLIAICFLSWIASAIFHPHLLVPIYSEGSKAFIFLLVNTYLVYAAAVRIADREYFRHRILITVYIVSAIASVYGVAQYFGTEWIWPHNLNPYGSRPVSTFGNPNFMSSFLVMVLPVLFADFVFGITRVPRIFVAAIFFSSLGALLATLTRSSWFGLVVSIAIVVWQSVRVPDVAKKVKKPLLFIVVAMVLAIVFWPKGAPGSYSATVFERFSEMREMTHGDFASASQRFLIWVSAWEMVLEHPFLGKGWGCFELFYPFYQGPLLFEPIFQSLRTHANNAHNEILEYWSQIGTLGLGVIVMLWVVYFRQGWSMIKRAAGPWRALQLGLLAGVAGMLVDNLLNVSIHFAVPAFLFWWWVGSSYLIDAEASRVVSVDLKAPWRKALVVASAVCLVCFMGRSVCLWAAEINFFEGFKLSKMGTDLHAAADSLTRAYEFHHFEVNNNYELANVYARLGDQPNALLFYRRAIEANAGYDEIYFNRGTLLAQLGRIPEAISDYQICLAINPRSQPAYNALGALYFKDAGRYAKELESLYINGTTAFPEDRDLWNNLGYLYTGQKRWEEAYQAYRKTLEVDPDFDTGWKNLKAIEANVKGHEGDPIMRVEALFKALRQQMLNHQWPDALATSREIEQALPHSFEAHFCAGNCLYSLGRYAESISEFQQALDRKKDNAALWQNFGAAEARVGNIDVARDAWQRALQLDPTNNVLKQQLAQVGP